MDSTEQKYGVIQHGNVCGGVVVDRHRAADRVVVVGVDRAQRRAAGRGVFGAGCGTRSGGRRHARHHAAIARAARSRNAQLGVGAVHRRDHT